MIELGILPPPKEDYFVKWQDLRTPSDMDKAKVGQIRAAAIRDYSQNPTAESIIPVEAFMRYCLGLSDKEIELIGEMQEEALKEEGADQAVAAEAA